MLNEKGYYNQLDEWEDDFQLPAKGEKNIKKRNAAKIEIINLVKGLGRKIDKLERTFLKVQLRVNNRKDDPLEPYWIKGALNILTET